MLTTDGSLPQQLGVVWSRLLEADSEGPSFISHAACARSVSSSRTFLSCACGAPSIVQRARPPAGGEFRHGGRVNEQIGDEAVLVGDLAGGLDDLDREP